MQLIIGIFGIVINWDAFFKKILKNYAHIKKKLYIC